MGGNCSVTSYPEDHARRNAVWNSLMGSEVVTLGILNNFRSKVQPNQIVTSVDWPAIENIELPVNTHPSDTFLLVAFLFYLRFEDLDSVFQYKALLAFNVIDAAQESKEPFSGFLRKISALPEVIPRGTYTLTANSTVAESQTPQTPVKDSENSQKDAEKADA